MARRRGTILQRARGYYAVASVVDEAGKRHRPRSGPFRTRREAETALGQMMADIDQGSFVTPDRTPIADYLARWLAARRHELRPTTAANYAGVVRRYVVPAIGSVAMKDLKPSHIARLYADMRDRGLSARTVRTVHIVLHRALADAVRDGTLVRNVADAVRLPRVEAPEMKTWDAEQLNQFLTATRDHAMHAGFFTAAMTGLRRGELLGVRWADVDLDDATLAVRRTIVVVDGVMVEGEPKTNRSRRVIDLDPVTIDVLRWWKVQQAERLLASGKRTDRVFPWRPEDVSAEFRKAARRAGVPVVRFHDLRHTSATLMLSAGLPVHVVSARLGHTSAVVTWGTYAHVLPGADAAAAETMRQMVFGDG